MFHRYGKLPVIAHIFAIELNLFVSFLFEHYSTAEYDIWQI